MDRQELADEQFARLAPHLPSQKPRTGRPAKDHRLVLEGILWILRTGAPWRDLPERYGSWRTGTPPGQEGGAGAGDKGYSSQKVRRYPRGRRIATRYEKRAVNDQATCCWSRPRAAGVSAR